MVSEEATVASSLVKTDIIMYKDKRETLQTD
jgi:hypothetical protein